MFYDPVEYGRKAEELLWRKVFYDIIQLIKNNRKVRNLFYSTPLISYFLVPNFRLLFIITFSAILLRSGD